MITLTVTVTDDQGNILEQSNHSVDVTPGDDNLSPTERALLAAAPEECPWDCTYCHEE